MATANLVELCSRVLTPDMIGAMSSRLGLDARTAKSAADGAVPALLASLGAAVEQPGGDRRLATAMAQVPDSALNDPAGFVLGRDGSLGGNGKSPLSAMLPPRTQDSLSHAIGRYASIGDGESKRLLTTVGLAVLSALGLQQRNSGLDASGLAKLLSSQRARIAGAIPQGLADQMNADGLADALKDRLRTGASAASSAATYAGRTVTAAATRPANRWLWWLLGFAVLSLLLVLAIGSLAGRNAAPRVAEPASTLMVGDVNLADEVGVSMNMLTRTLEGITDAASARTALPALDDVSRRLANIGSLDDQLAPDGRARLAAAAMRLAPEAEREFDRILAIPGAADVVRPVVTDLRTRLNAIGS